MKEINIKDRLYNYYFDKLIKAKKSETKNILIDENLCEFSDLFYFICSQ